MSNKSKQNQSAIKISLPSQKVLTLDYDQKIQQAEKFLDSGQTNKAEELFRQILQQDQRSFAALYYLGVIAAQQNNWQEASELFTRCININPNNHQAYFNLALSQQNQQQFPAALASYRRVIALNPLHSKAYTNCANVLAAMQQWSEAVSLLQQAIKLDAQSAAAYANLGVAYMNLGEFSLALSYLDQAIAINANDPVSHSNRGGVLQELNRLDEGLASCQRAIQLNPQYPEAYHNYANILQQQNQILAAHQYYIEALTINPGFLPSIFNLALVLLVQGDLLRGFELYEHRSTNLNFFPERPKWTGKEDLNNKTILLLAEQGYGDTLQFCRYASLLAQRGAKVILAVPPPLITILQSLSGVSEVIAYGQKANDFDYYCSLLSLPYLLQTTLTTIPASIPYLHATTEKLDYWQKKLGSKNKTRIGLLWSGGYRAERPDLWNINQRRNIPLKQFASLFQLADQGFEFYSLQLDAEARKELAELPAENSCAEKIIDLTGEITDFSDTAALIMQLELVITVDTACAHLAGALGKPFWLLNRYDSCWRWLMERRDTPWYPQATIYRQAAAGDWSSVLTQVSKDLLDNFTESKING